MIRSRQDVAMCVPWTLQSLVLQKLFRPCNVMFLRVPVPSLQVCAVDDSEVQAPIDVPAKIDADSNGRSAMTPSLVLQQFQSVARLTRDAGRVMRLHF